MANLFKEMNLPFYPLLSEEETRELLQKSAAGDQEAREKLINHNLRLVFNLVQRFAGKGYDLEDLFQIGVIGLMKAVDRFNPEFDVRFSTYAVPLILGEIRRYLRDDQPVKLTRSLKEGAVKVHKMRDTLLKELGREPTVQELARALDMASDEVLATLEAMQTPVSMQEALYQDDGDPVLLEERLTEEGTGEKMLEKLALKEVIDKLPERDRQLLHLRFFADKTQMQVAEILGISQVQVSRLERQALQNLRKLLSG